MDSRRIQRSPSPRTSTRWSTPSNGSNWRRPPLTQAPPDVINLFKCLPRREYATREAVQRDLSEASRRSALGGSRDDDDGVNRDRRNIGRDAVEDAPDGQTRHP
ncbi:hypothetical protein QEG98_10465 [Myxococcus sp. MxC21-1]|uniref:hypothetical protein n=1 Tax=Myxococcus sp. MxC21-1 TaxID=3041439 RepID=UPI00292F57A9|nr:hypothetical protein [Myxococcus sp. MxC21-1]WNZ64060.1 hypothetical protein QEG98_10465 [Myxococcus sp. MxC21-1]